jgi:hypothetical protein
VRKPRNNTPYGRSHFEQILTWANIGIRAQRFLLEYYTSGNTPEMLIPVDASTPAEKVEEWNEMLDTTLSGQDDERRTIKMVPVMNSSGKFEPVFPKQPLLVSQLDEFLARIVCFTLGLNPQAFVKSMNRATAEQAQDSAEAEGQVPVIRWLEDVMNECIIRMGYGDTHEFTFRIAREQDGLKQMQIDTGYLAKGVWSGIDPNSGTWTNTDDIYFPAVAVNFGTGSVSYTAMDAGTAAFTGPGQTVYVCIYDPTHAGGTPTVDVQPTNEHATTPGYFYLGTITSAAAPTSPGTSGGSSAPGGPQDSGTPTYVIEVNGVPVPITNE